MQAVQVQHYIQRASDFFERMQLTKDDEKFQNSSALLAIHSAISYNDALRIGLGDTMLSADDHQTAVDSFGDYCLSGASRIKAAFNICNSL